MRVLTDSWTACCVRRRCFMEGQKGEPCKYQKSLLRVATLGVCRKHWEERGCVRMEDLGHFKTTVLQSKHHLDNRPRRSHNNLPARGNWRQGSCLDLLTRAGSFRTRFNAGRGGSGEIGLGGRARGIFIPHSTSSTIQRCILQTSWSIAGSPRVEPHVASLTLRQIPACPVSRARTGLDP